MFSWILAKVFRSGITTVWVDVTVSPVCQGTRGPTSLEKTNEHCLLCYVVVVSSPRLDVPMYMKVVSWSLRHSPLPVSAWMVAVLSGIEPCLFCCIAHCDRAQVCGTERTWGNTHPWGSSWQSYFLYGWKFKKCMKPVPKPPGGCTTNAIFPKYLERDLIFIQFMCYVQQENFKVWQKHEKQARWVHLRSSTQGLPQVHGRSFRCCHIYDTQTDLHVTDICTFAPLNAFRSLFRFLRLHIQKYVHSLMNEKLPWGAWGSILVSCGVACSESLVLYLWFLFFPSTANLVLAFV